MFQIGTILMKNLLRSLNISMYIDRPHYLYRNVPINAEQWLNEMAKTNEFCF